MKNIVLSLVCIGLFSSLVAEDMGLVTAVVKVAETKIKEDGATARAGKSTVVIDSGSKISALSKMDKDNLVVGAVGTVAIVGEDVEISGSEVSAESHMGTGNKVIGTAGSVLVGGH